MGIGQTEQTKFAIGQLESAAEIVFQTIESGLTGPPVRGPSRPGLSWVADLILNYKFAENM